MSATKSEKDLRREKSKEKQARKLLEEKERAKKALRNKMLMVCGCILAAAIIVTLVILSSNREAPARLDNPSNPFAHEHNEFCSH
jgi:uncharacterized membrane protein YvbJ